jgi:type VI secretion system secreted protein Hcp
MSQKNAARVLAFLAATSALAWIGSPVPATAAPDGKALASAQPTTRHVAVLKGSAGEVSIDVLALTHEIISPRDAASGLPSGKRQHKPFTITKPVDKSSPLLFESLVKGEPFQVEVTTLRRTGGRWMPFVTVRLDNAFVAAINPRSADDRPTEEVSFYYGKIAFSYAETGTTVEDVWGGEYP